MSSAGTEWIVVSNRIAIIARETGESWAFDLEEDGEISPFSRPMTGKGTSGSTATLLNGALALGFGSDGSQFADHVNTLPKYVFNLIGAYHNARRTPANYVQAANRFKELGRTDLAAYLEKHAREETGHDRLVLKDLRALGLPAERIVANLIPEGVKPLCEFFDRLSSSEYPIGCIGYSYCFECTAAMKQKADVDGMQALCPEGVEASRFLRTHSQLGSEVSHVAEMIDFIASLPASDRTEIVKATYETAAMTASLRQDVLKSDTTILSEIQAAAGEDIRLSA